jgi:hypothetical protein
MLLEHSGQFVGVDRVGRKHPSLHSRAFGKNAGYCLAARFIRADQSHG